MPLANTSHVTHRTNASRDIRIVSLRPTHSPRAIVGNKHSANINSGQSAYTPAIRNKLKRTTVLQLINALCVARADTWAASWGAGQPDTPLAALREVGSIGIGGLFTLGRATLHELRLALSRTPTKPLDTLMDKP